jgi:hypothetical protein
VVTPITAVGIVQDVRYVGLEADIQPVIYLLFDQAPEREVNIVLHSSAEPVSLAAVVWHLVSADSLAPR